MAGNGLLPLFVVVLLCFTCTNAGNLTFSYFNATTGGYPYFSVSLDQWTTATNLTVTISPPGRFNPSTFTHTFTSGVIWGFYAQALLAGKATFSFSSSNTTEYPTPASQDVYTFVGAQFTGQNFYPGTTVSGIVSLDASPNTLLTAQFVSYPAGLVFNPSSFAFKQGDAPYEAKYTVTSKLPGTYYVTLAFGDVDGNGGWVSPSPNVTFAVDKRLVRSTPTGSFSNVMVGQSTSPVLVYLDVAPETDVTVNVIPSSNNVVATPSQLNFSPTVTALSYTLSGSAPASSIVAYNLSGTDSAKYSLSSAPSISVINRTIIIPTLPSVAIGVTSKPVSVYLSAAITTSLTLSFSSTDGSLTFTPSSITFDANHQSGTFVYTATNAAGPNARSVIFTLSGTAASQFTVPAASSVNIAGAIRHVSTSFSHGLDSVPLNFPVTGALSLDVTPPTSFSVSLSAANVVFSPSTITFSNSTGGLVQSFSFRASALGSSRIYYAISGIDAAVVDPIPSQAVTVVAYTAPYFTGTSSASVGAVFTVSIVVPEAVINGLNIAISTTPSSLPVTISPSSFAITSTSPPGTNAGSTSYSFALTASQIGTFQIQATLSGPDWTSGLFPSVASYIVTVTAVNFGALTGLTGPYVVGVPVSNLRISLATIHASTVTLTPSSSSLQFTPSSLVFDSVTTEACFSFVPLVAADTVITWTSSDPVNYPAPSPIAISPINKKSFNIGALGDNFNLGVGVTSDPFLVRVDYPPFADGVILVPGSTDGLIFSPTSLVFTPTATVQYLSITATKLDNPYPVITWQVQGSDAASFSTPGYVNGLEVIARTLTLSSTNFATTPVNVTSLPIFISTDSVVANGLTLTPSARGVVFSPPSATIQGDVRFVYFTAIYPVWANANTNNVNLDVKFAYSGTDAGLFYPIAASIQFSRRQIYLDYATILRYNAPAVSGQVSVEVAPERDLTITFCAPNVLSFNPASVTIPAGQVQAPFLMEANLVVGTAPLSSAVISVEVKGAGASFYRELGTYGVSLYYTGDISVSGFPSNLWLGDSPVVFEISVPFLEFTPFTVAITHRGGLSIVPSEIRFSPTNLHYFVSVEATRVLDTTYANSFAELVSFEVVGSPEIFTPPGQYGVTVYRRGIYANWQTQEQTVGIPILGSLSLDLPPSTSTLTITPVSSPGVTFSPSTLVFNSNATLLPFSVSSKLVGEFGVSWVVTGTEAAFYSAADDATLYFDPRYVNINPSSVNLAPGRLGVVHVSLSLPAINGLTITPVLPSGLQASPATLSLTPGTAGGYFTFSSNGNLYTNDESSITFILGGSDANVYIWDSSATITVELQQGEIYVSSLYTTTVGVPSATTYISLDRPTLNGLTITPWVHGASVSPSVIQFTPGVSTASVIFTPFRAGYIPVFWNVSGPDAWLYSHPSSSGFDSEFRTISIWGDSFVEGQSLILFGEVNVPPPTSFVLSATTSGLTINPPSFQFSPTIASHQVVITASTCGVSVIPLTPSGADAGWYDVSSYPYYTLDIPCHTVSFSGPFETYPNGVAYARATLSAPASVTITPSAPGCTFNPLALVFGAQVLSVKFSYVCNVAATTDSPNIPIIYTITGVDAGLVEQPVLSSDISVYATILDVPSGTFNPVSGQAVSFLISLNALPSAAVTVTPSASNAIFSPSSFTFGTTISGLLTVTPTSPGFVRVNYLLSGPGSASVGINNAYTEIYAEYGSIIFNLDSYSIGEESDLITFRVDPPSINGLTLTPRAPGCTFSPTSLVFAPYSATSTTSYTCNSVGSIAVEFSISGADSEHYAIPPPYIINIGTRDISASISSAQVFEDNYEVFTLSTPTENGVTLTPTAPGVTFVPAIITFPPGSSSAGVRVRGTQVGNSLVSWAVSGADAALYDAPSWHTLSFAPRLVTAYVPNGNVYSGLPSNTFSVVLDRAPTTGLSVTPYGAGLTFTPKTLSFGPGQTGASFVVQVSVAGTFTIHYAISGADAVFYSLESESTISTSLIYGDIYFENYDSYVGVPSTPYLIYIQNGLPSDNVQVEFVGAGTFDPPTLTLGPTVGSSTVRFTPNTVGDLEIVVLFSGPGAADLADSRISTWVTVNPRIIRVPTNLPDLFAGVSSSQLSVAVDYAPPTGFILTPSAANTVFTPSSFSFTPSSTHFEFKLVSNQPAEFNDGTDYSSAPTVVSWSLSGTDATWYETLDTFEIFVVPRDLVYQLPSSVYLGVPFIVTVTTSYPPNGQLVITPGGAFTFSPSSFTLTSAQPTASFNVTAVAPNNQYFRFHLSGSDASLYEVPDWQEVTVSKLWFNIPSFGYILQQGEWTEPIIIRPNIVPPVPVSLTLSSDYLDFSPSTLTFGPASPAGLVTIQLRGLAFDRKSSFNVDYWRSGPGANLFEQPETSTVYWEGNVPTRSLVLNNPASYLVAGIPSAPVSILIPNFPVSSLIITPVPFSPHISFNPPFLQFNRTSTSLGAWFTVLASRPTVSGQVQFALTGPDAIFYSPPSFYADADYRYVDFTYSNLVVGLESQPFSASLRYPTPNGLTITLSSYSIAFTPSVLVFLPNVSRVTFTATAGTVGNSIPVKAVIGGADVDLYAPVSFDDAWNANSRSWDEQPYGTSLSPGERVTLVYSARTAPSSSLTITPWAPSLIFEPASFTLQPNSSSATFYVSGATPGNNIGVKTILSGPDALWYDPINEFDVYLNFLSVYIQSAPSGVDLGETGVIIVRADEPVDGLYVTLSATGLVFFEPTIYFPPGVQYVHAPFFATAVGASSYKLTFSGPDAHLYQYSQTGSYVWVNENYLSTDGTDDLLVGGTSSTIAVYSRGGSGTPRGPIAPIIVSFLISPPGAATVTPPNATISNPISSVQIQVTPHIVSNFIAITPVISGPGASYYASYSPVITFSSYARTFEFTDPINYRVYPRQNQYIVGVVAGPFGVTAKSVPSDVELYLSAPGLKFVPSVLRFTGTYETLYFKVIPQKAINTRITFSVGGTDAGLFSVPNPSPSIRVTHQFVIPSLPSIIVGKESSPQTIFITSPVTSTVVLTPYVDYNCGPEEIPFVSFFPPFLIFTPNSTQQTFTYIGNCANFNLGNNYNPLVIGDAENRYDSYPSSAAVYWDVTEAGDSSGYQLSLPLSQSVNAITILPATFKVQFSALKLGSVSDVTISVTAAPRSDVVLTLIGNNLNFNPPHVTFHPNVTSQTIQVSFVHSDFKDSDNIPFTVDYIIGGSNFRDYIPPAQSFIGVGRGEADVVGAICGGSDAGSVRVGVLTIVAIVIVAILGQ